MSGHDCGASNAAIHFEKSATSTAVPFSNTLGFDRCLRGVWILYVGVVVSSLSAAN